MSTSADDSLHQQAEFSLKEWVATCCSIQRVDSPLYAIYKLMYLQWNKLLKYFITTMFAACCTDVIDESLAHIDGLSWQCWSDQNRAEHHSRPSRPKWATADMWICKKVVVVGRAVVSLVCGW